MKETIKNILNSKLFQSSAIYTLINFINKVFPFILLPLFTRIFSLEEYGNFSLYKASISFCIPLLGLSLSESVIRKFYEKEALNYGEYIFSVIFINLITLVTLLGSFLLFESFFVSTIGLPRMLIVSAIIVSFFTCINNIERGLFRCENENKYFAMVVIGQSILYFFLILLLYQLDKLTLQNSIYIEVFVYLVFAIISIIYLINKYKIKFNVRIEYLGEALKFSLPLVLNSLLAYTFALSDRFIINFRLDSDAVGIYSASFQIASILQILAFSFNSAWIPWVFNALKQKMAMKKIRRIQLFLSFGYFVIGGIFWLVSYKFLPFIIGEKYSAGRALLIWFIAANLCQAMYWLVSPIIQYNKKNWLLITASIPALIFSVSLNLVFLSQFGIEFAAKVNFVSWFIILVITVINVKKFYKLN